MRKPILYREILVWWHCPEIRKHIAKAIGYRLSWYLVLLVLIVPAGIIVALAFICDALSRFCHTAGDFILTPSQRLYRLKQNCVTEAHKILPVEEIRKRIYGKDEPIILSKDKFEEQ